MTRASKDFLHFWRRETAAAVRDWRTGGRRGQNPLNALPMPYAEGLVEPGDRVYAVEVNWPGTRFDLLGRVEAGTVGFPPNDPRGLVVVTAKRGTATRCGPIAIPRSTSAKLRIAYADGAARSLNRRSDGTIVAGAYQGRASVRELVAGAKELEKLLSRQS